MDIQFWNSKVKKQFPDEWGPLQKIHGEGRAKCIRVRLTALRAAVCLADLAPDKGGKGRCHDISDSNKNKIYKLSIDLDGPYRLTFTPNHEPIPEHKKIGGLDWSQVTAITIIGVENTHE